MGKIMIERKIRCCWFDWEMSPDRASCYQSMIDNSGVSVELITENNMWDYEISSSPYFRGFKYMNATNKASYLRAYFIYHYGGGWQDIKWCDFDWNPYFDILENSDESIDFIGYQELSKGTFKEFKNDVNELAGNCRYIWKPKTEMAEVYYNRCLEYLESVYDELVKYPGNYHARAEPGGVEGIKGAHKGSKYPIPWAKIFCGYMHKTQLEYRGRFLKSMPHVNAGVNYR
jgi:hypothetical protein